MLDKVRREIAERVEEEGKDGEKEEEEVKEEDGDKQVFELEEEVVKEGEDGDGGKDGQGLVGLY